MGRHSHPEVLSPMDEMTQAIERYVEFMADRDGSGPPLVGDWVVSVMVAVPDEETLEPMSTPGLIVFARDTASCVQAFRVLAAGGTSLAAHLRQEDHDEEGTHL